MSELNAKFRYIQLCRSLKTYGITTFECAVTEEKGKKKKDKRVLLGVTRDSVLFLDPETKVRVTTFDCNPFRKEITHTSPLKTLKRWASSSAGTSLTLDFGDYQQNYVVLRTNKAEQISSLIAGYIDIILKARKGKK